MHPAQHNGFEARDPGFVYPSIPLAPMIAQQVQAYSPVVVPVEPREIQTIVLRDPLLWRIFRFLVLLAVVSAAAIEASMPAPLPVMIAYGMTAMLLLCGVTVVDRQRFLSASTPESNPRENVESEYTSVGEQLMHQPMPSYVVSQPVQFPVPVQAPAAYPEPVHAPHLQYQPMPQQSMVQY